MQASAVVSYYSKLGHWDLHKMIERDKRKDGSSTMVVENSIMKIKSTSIEDRAYTFHNIFIPTGGWVEVEFMAKAVSGVGKYSVNLYDAPTFDGTGSDDDITISDRDWKYYRHAYPATKGKNYLRLLFGQWRNTIGEVWFKEVTIKGYNTNPHPDFRFAAIKGKGTSWNVDDGLGGYANDGIIGAVQKSDYIEVEFVPFNTWYQPSFQVSALRDGNDNNYIPIVGIQATNPNRYCRIYIMNPTTGKFLNAKDITTDMTIFFEAKGR